MGSDIEEIDLSSINSAPVFRPRAIAHASTPVSAVHVTNPVPTQKATSFRSSFAQASTASGGAMDYTPARYQMAYPPSFDDSFVDIDSTSQNREPRQQPRPKFRLPKAINASEPTEAVFATQSSPSKRKRTDLTAGLRTPSRSSGLDTNDAGTSSRGHRRHRSTILTPPFSTTSRSRTLSSDSPPPPSIPDATHDPDSMTATLNTLAHTITNLHTQYQQPMEDLARKVNFLTHRLTQVEAENRELRAHVHESFESFAQQTDKSVHDRIAHCLDRIEMMEEQMDAGQPVAGGAHGGPAYTGPSRPSSLFHNMLSKDGRAGQGS